jgi:hypothetical protein
MDRHEPDQQANDDRSWVPLICRGRYPASLSEPSLYTPQLEESKNF